jgi:transcription elongation factor Elf1
VGKAEQLIRRLEGKLTDEEYVAANGFTCPFCHSVDTVETAMEEEFKNGRDCETDHCIIPTEPSLYARRIIRCTNCDKKYYDVYKIVGYEEIHDD